MRRAWKWWQGVARKIGDVQARILLTFFYFVVVSPFALVVRYGSDPLAIKEHTPRGWRRRLDEQHISLQRAKGQF